MLKTPTSQRFQFFALIMLLVFGSVPVVAGPSKTTRLAVKGLSMVEARQRSLAVENIHYNLQLSLSDKAGDKGPGDKYSGSVDISFDIKDTSVPVNLDFQDGDVKELVVNGKTQSHVEYNKFFISLPPLKSGPNTVIVRFQHAYSSTGSGLYRFKDPEDGRSYVYSDFEPYDASAMFPCFDQPDLKATYTVEVEAPAEWIVVTSIRESAPPTVKNGRSTWSFPESSKFSTYLFSLIGGPYKVWEGMAGDIPLRLLARPSLAKFVPADEWLKVTAQGLAFYNAYFNFAYPFKKYDQIIVPDFNAGAMENVAAVTFSERYVPRGAETTAAREGRANVILHEMAHMWFGDLVTMRWWNDLWLNESFATYMASLALVEATDFKRAWESFYNGTKQWAYWEDQLVTTHPIEGDAPDTEQAFANFDGITYGKGASTMKSLSYFIGPDKFRDGVRAYFKTHAYQNTELKDFMGALATASGRDLNVWSEQWLKTAGVNTVEARYSCEGGTVKGFSLSQTAPLGLATLRAHKAQVAFFRKGDSGVSELLKSVDVDYSGEITAVPALDGVACPEIVYPNYNDYDFVKVRFDLRSLEGVKNSLNVVPDPLLRSMYWTALWDAVLDGQWPVSKYADTVAKQIGIEKDEKILEAVLDKVRPSRRSSRGVVDYLAPESAAQKSFVSNMEITAGVRLEAAQSGSDDQKIWFDFLVRIAASADSQKRLEALLDGKTSIPGLDVDQDRRWNIVFRLIELKAPRANQLRLAEAKRDLSSRGRQSAITAEALQPSKSNKALWYKKIINHRTKMSLADLKSAMTGMFPPSQAMLSKEFSRQFFTNLPKLVKVRENEFLERFTRNMAPAYCEKTSAGSLLDFAAKPMDLPPVVLKALRVAAQEDGRCVRIRAFDGNGAKK
jgi:aminopeptidase N